MKKFQIVIDTNVLIAGLRSNKGASAKLLSLSDSNKFEINISVPLILE
jgi:predicted nucleic acid-binding protein